MGCVEGNEGFFCHHKQNRFEIAANETGLTNGV